MEVHDIVQEAVIKIIPKKKKCKKAKWLSEEALQIAEKRRETKGKGEKDQLSLATRGEDWASQGQPKGSLLFSAISKASSDNHFAFLHFFFLGMVLYNVMSLCS